MSSYRLRRDRKYKRRRTLITFTTALCVVALVMAGYLIYNKDRGTHVDNPGNASNTSVSNTSSSGSSSSGSSQEPGTSTQEPSDSTAGVPEPGKNSNTVETKNHGVLPKVGTIEKSGKMEELKKLITDYTSNLPGKYGVTFIDLATGEMVSVNDKVEYIAASTSKLPINVLLFKNIEAGKISLDDKLVYKNEDFEAGTGIIQQSSFGRSYTVRETSKLSIRKSDNCGVNMLIRLLGIENVRSYIDEVGGQVHYGKTHRSCPYDMAMIAQDLYKHYLNNEDVYGELIDNMENTDWSDRIDAKLPDNVKVAHKIGNQVKTANDVGIVFATHPYVLSVMTENVEVGAAYNSIANLSKKIYDFEEAYAAKDSGTAQ